MVLWLKPVVATARLSALGMAVVTIPVAVPHADFLVLTD